MVAGVSMLSSTNTLNGVRITSSLTQGRDLLAEVSRLVSYRYDLPETFDGLLLHLRSALHVDLLTLALADAQSHTVRMRYSCATEVVRANLPVELSLNDSPSGMAWSTQQTVLVSDVANERRWPSSLNPLRSAGVATYCSIPLTAGDRRLGALSLGSVKLHAFGDDDLELLRQIAIPVAMAVENELIREYADRYKRTSCRPATALLCCCVAPAPWPISPHYGRYCTACAAFCPARLPSMRATSTSWMTTRTVCICRSSIKMRKGPRLRLEPNSCVSARWRKPLMNSNQFSYRTYLRKC